MKDAAGVGRNERGDWRSSQANQPGPFERADAAWEVFKMVGWEAGLAGKVQLIILLGTSL